MSGAPFSPSGPSMHNGGGDPIFWLILATTIVAIVAVAVGALLA